MLWDCVTAVRSYVSWQRLLGMIAFTAKSEQAYKGLNTYFLFVYFFVLFFRLILHRPAVRISLPFHPTSLISTPDPGLQLGDPAPLIGLLLWTWCHFMYFKLFLPPTGYELYRAVFFAHYKGAIYSNKQMLTLTRFRRRSFHELACEAQTYFRSSLLSLRKIK